MDRQSALCEETLLGDLHGIHEKIRWRGKWRNGAGNGIRTRDFDLGKVALYH